MTKLTRNLFIPFLDTAKDSTFAENTWKRIDYSTIFEVQLVMQDEDTEKIMLTKRVMSPHFYLGEQKDDDEVVCIFGEQEIPTYRSFRFEVRPVECFGKKGRPICSEWMKV